MQPHMVSVAALRRYVVAQQGYASRFRRATPTTWRPRSGACRRCSSTRSATVDRAHRLTLVSRIGAFDGGRVSRLARGPRLRVLGARGLPAADRGLPALQAADGRPPRPALVGPRAAAEAGRSSASARAPPRRRRAARSRVRGPERADVGLEARKARARASIRGRRGRDRGPAGLPAPLRAAGARDPERHLDAPAPTAPSSTEASRCAPSRAAAR